MHYIHKFDTSSIDWNGFRDYVYKKYAISWARTVYSYAKKYVDLINNPSIVETFSGSKKNAVLKSLIAFSKYFGFYPLFKKRIKDFGIKWHRSSSVDSFLRIMNNSNRDILRWYNEAGKALANSKDLSYLSPLKICLAPALKTNAYYYLQHTYIMVTRDVVEGVLDCKTQYCIH